MLSVLLNSYPAILGDYELRSILESIDPAG